LKQEKAHIDWWIFISVITLMLFSIAFVYSAGSYFALIKGSNPESLLLSHTIRVFLAIAVMFVTAKVDYHFWSKISFYLMVISLISLVVVLAIGTNVGGAKRWINLGIIPFQPSELAKFSVILHFGTLISRKKEQIRDLKYGYLPFILWLMLIGMLIGLEPNFSMLILIFLIGLVILYLGNARIKHILITIAIGAVGGGIYAISSTYRLNRILFYLGLLEGNAKERLSFQVENSLIALGSGGIFGLGPGGSRQNLLLSEPYNDFLFSIVGEEYGLIGLIMIILLFTLFLWRCVYIAKRAPDQLGYLYVMGITFSILIFFIINALVNTALIPTTGVPLPFLSYGGTAIIFNAILVGIILNISTKIKHKTTVERNQ
jgi:cell division protein FtsW